MRQLMVALAAILWSLTARAELPTHAFTLDNGLTCWYARITAPVTRHGLVQGGSIDEAPMKPAWPMCSST